MFIILQLLQHMKQNVVRWHTSACVATPCVCCLAVCRHTNCLFFWIFSGFSMNFWQFFQDFAYFFGRTAVSTHRAMFHMAYFLSIFLNWGVCWCNLGRLNKQTKLCTIIIIYFQEKPSSLVMRDLMNAALDVVKASKL